MRSSAEARRGQPRALRAGATAASILLALATFCAPAATRAQGSPGGTDTPASMYSSAVRAGTIDIPGLEELSGLAVSRLRDDVLWAHNDSGNQPLLFAIGTDGRSRGTFFVEGASRVDWEDIASFELDGTAYLVIGDVGDNNAVRSQVRLMVVREPALPDGGAPPQGTVSIAWDVWLRYPDGPRDVESVAVDRGAGEILLMSKRVVPPAVYAVPMRPTSSEPATARRVGEVTIPKPEDRGIGRALLGRFALQPTAMDIAADGGSAIVQTYTDAYLYRRKDGAGWGVTFAAEPERVRIPRMTQVEAVAFDHSGRSFFVSTEVLPSPLFRLDPAGAGN